MEKPIHITPSLEDYLKTIHHLETQSRVARAKDIAQAMSVSRASVTGALKSLSQKGLIDYSPYSYVTLTEDGRGLARELDQRHEVLFAFFTRLLGFEDQPADELACKVEHSINSSVVDRVSALLKFVGECPRTSSRWQAFLPGNCPGQHDQSLCNSCMNEVPLKREAL